MSVPAKIYRRSELEAIKPAIDADGCLYRWKQIWAEGVDDTTDVALVGIAFHAVNHAYISLLMEAHLGQDEDLAEQAFIAGVAAAQTPSRLIPQVRDVWQWHAESFELDCDRFVAAEEHGASGNVGFTPDLVLAHPERNALEIIDTKSGWHPPLSVEELKVLFQARVYSAYAKQRWPNFTSYEFTLVAVRFRKKVTVSFTPEELEKVEQEVRAAIATIEYAIKTDSFPAIAGPSCHFCNLQCPIADQSVTLAKRLTLEQYNGLGQWLLVADKQLKAAKKLMKASAAVYGPCQVNGVVWENRPSTSRQYPIDAVLEAFKTAGIMGAWENSAENGLTLSESALAKTFKQYPLLREALQPFAKEKTAYRFSAKAPGVDDGEDE